MNDEEIEKLALKVVELISEKMTDLDLSRKEILTISECARYAGVSKSFFYKLTMDKKIPFYRPAGKLLFINRLDLENWLRQNRSATNTELGVEAQAFCMNRSIKH